MAYPTTLDTFSNPNSAGGDTLATVPHDTQHGQANDAIEALEAKVGIDGSAVPTSLDMRVTELESGLLAVGASGALLLPVKKNGALIGTRHNLNLIEGTGITLTVADDAANDEVDVTITGSTAAKGLLEVISYNPASPAFPSTSSTSISDVDATNLVITFTPNSTQVLVRLNAYVQFGGSTLGYWGLREGTTQVGQARVAASGVAQRQTAEMLITGLTAGVAKTYKWAWKNSTVTSQEMRIGSGASEGGPATMSVWDA